MKEYIIIYEYYVHALYGFDHARYSLYNSIRKSIRSNLSIDIVDEQLGEVRLRFMSDTSYHEYYKSEFKGTALNGYFFDKKLDEYDVKNNIVRL